MPAIMGVCVRCGHSSSNLSLTELCPYCDSTNFYCSGCGCLLDNKRDAFCSTCSTRFVKYCSVVGLLVILCVAFYLSFSIPDTIKDLIIVGIIVGFIAFFSFLLCKIPYQVLLEMYNSLKPVKKTKIRDFVYSYREAPNDHEQTLPHRT